jgi:4-amino-4-deoxy-L-arabinose transferase-like glycosyltransferase
VLTRLVCLLCAVAIVSAGLREQSLALVVLASAIVMVALMGVGDDRPFWRDISFPSLRDRATWAFPDLPRVALTVGGLAIGFCVLSIMTVPSTNTFGILSAVAWFVAIAAVLVLGPLLDQITVAEIASRLRAPFTREHRPETLSVVAMTVVAFALRFYQLETIPMMFHGDEGIVGQIALRPFNGVFAPLLIVNAEWPQPYVYTYMETLSMWVFGTTVFGLRMLGIFFGALGVPIVYAIGRVGWGPAAGAIAAWLFAVSHLQNHYSRIGTFVIESVPLMALVLLLLALAYERGRPCAATGMAASTETRRRGMWTLLVLAGLTCGFAQYFYYGSRLIPIVVAPLLVLLWGHRRITVWQGAAFAFGFLIIIGPLAAHYIDNPAQFSGRLNEVSIFQESYVKQVVGEGATMPWALPALLFEQTQRSLHLFVRGGDQGGFYSGNTPNFDVVTSALIWLGLGAALSRPWRYHETSVLLWFVLGLIFSSILTLGARSGQRVLIMTTAAFLFGGVLVARVWDLLNRLPGRGNFSWLAPPIGTTLALWLLSANITIYFFEYVPRAEMSEQAMVAREIASGGNQYHNYILTVPVFDQNHDAIKFIARGIPVTNLRNVAEFQPPPNDGLGTAIIALEMHLQALRSLEARVPGGTEQTVNAPNGRILYIVYRVPPGR